MRSPTCARFDSGGLAADIRSYRTETGTSLRAFASHIGCGPSAVGLIENTRMIPNAGLFLAICDLIDTDPADYHI